MRFNKLQVDPARPGIQLKWDGTGIATHVQSILNQKKSSSAAETGVLSFIQDC
jgi:hypothetical protein